MAHAEEEDVKRAMESLLDAGEQHKHMLLRPTPLTLLMCVGARGVGVVVSRIKRSLFSLLVSQAC